MRRLVSLVLALVFCLGLFSSCSGKEDFSKGDFVVSAEDFFDDALHSLLSPDAYEVLFGSSEKKLEGSVSFDSLSFYDEKQAKEISLNSLLSLSFTGARSFDGWILDGDGKLAEDPFSFSSSFAPSGSEITVRNYIENEFSVNLTDFTGLCALSTLKNDIFLLMNTVFTETEKNVKQSTIEKSFEKVDGLGKITKYSAVFNNALSKDYASSVIEAIFSSSPAVSNSLGSYFFNINEIIAGDKAQYGKNLIARINADNNFNVRVNKYEYKNRVVQLSVEINATDEDLCRKLIYSCPHEDDVSLSYISSAIGMPIFSMTLNDGLYTVDFNNSYVFSFKKNEATDNFDTEIKFIIPRFSEFLYLKMSFTEEENETTVNLSFYDNNKTFEGEIKLCFALSDKYEEKSYLPSPDSLMIDNSIEGAAVYDKVTEKLFSKVPELALIMPYDISVTKELSPEVGGVIGDDEYSLTPYLFYLQQNRDYYYTVAKTYYADQLSAGKDVWSVILTTGNTVKEEIFKTAEKDYISSYYIDKYFEQSELDLSFEDLVRLKDEINQTFTPDALKEFCSNIGCSEEGLRYLFSLYYKQAKIFDSFYGKAGTEPITDELLKEVFNENYLGFKYVLLFNFDINDPDYSSFEGEELEKVRARAKECFKKVSTKEISMEDAIKTYSSEFYSDEEITSSGEDPDEIKKFNKELLEGFVIDRQGYTDDKNSNPYPLKIVEMLSDMKYGSVEYLEDDDNGFWIFERIDISDRFGTYRETLYSSASTRLQEELIESWIKLSEYKLKDSCYSVSLEKMGHFFFLQNANETE